ncbi:hypothetical protein ACFVVA_41900 [Kitasatospora sp. NPDC058048]|uniref:hypothetical protein n=1 Tax=Kitasatospora sp. NPDC058048 TaxID=3346313 RepID=UPI0036DA4DF4
MSTPLANSMPPLLSAPALSRLHETAMPGGWESLCRPHGDAPVAWCAATSEWGVTVGIAWEARLDGALVEGTLQLRKGAQQSLTFRSAALVNKSVTLGWDGDSADQLGITFEPALGAAQAISAAGVTWTINCRSARPGAFAVVFKATGLDAPIVLKGNLT